MSTKIRLARGGSKKKPFYKIVVTNSRSPRDGDFIEKLGTYNPLLEKENPQHTVINLDRAKYWLGVGAQPSPRVEVFLRKAGLITTAQRPFTPKKPKKEAKAEAAA